MVVDGNRELYDRIVKNGIVNVDEVKGKVKVTFNSAQYI